jgi:hypothetical protein
MDILYVCLIDTKANIWEKQKRPLKMSHNIIKTRVKEGFHIHQYHNKHVTRRPLTVFAVAVGKKENKDVRDASSTSTLNLYLRPTFCSQTLSTGRQHTKRTQRRQHTHRTQHTHVTLYQIWSSTRRFHVSLATSLTTYKATWRNIPKDMNFQ